MLYCTQQEADRAHTKANLNHFTLLEDRGTIQLLAKERRRLRRQRQARDDTIAKLKARVSKLKEYVSDLENHLEEVEEGMDLHKERDALLSDDEDYLEDMNMEDHEDEDDDDFIDDEEEDAHIVDLDDESEASDV
jgi:cell division protein FtsB